MQRNVISADPWTMTLGLLAALSPSIADVIALPVASRPTLEEAEQHVLSRRFVAPIIRILDRPNASTLIVDWVDSTHCSYREQIWRMVRAHMSGRCVLSGAVIKKRDLVYTPRHRAGSLNGEAMILASVVADVEVLESRPANDEKLPNLA